MLNTKVLRAIEASLSTTTAIISRIEADHRLVSEAVRSLKESQGHLASLTTAAEDAKAVTDAAEVMAESVRHLGQFSAPEEVDLALLTDFPNATGSLRGNPLPRTTADHNLISRQAWNDLIERVERLEKIPTRRATCAP